MLKKTLLLTTLYLTHGLFAASQPNILIILVDDLGYGDLRSYNPDSKILYCQLIRPTTNSDQQNSVEPSESRLDHFWSSSGLRFCDRTAERDANWTVTGCRKTGCTKKGSRRRRDRHTECPPRYLAEARETSQLECRTWVKWVRLE
jgi:hypothetical protein